MNKFVIINNKQCQFIPKNQEIFNKLRNYLSYRVEGVEYTAAYQNGWSGINFLMSPKGKFPLGLLKMAQNWLITSGEEYTVEDQRPPIKNAPELDITQRLIDINKVPREHQIKIL